MAKKSKTSQKTKEAANKVSYHYKPDNLTLEEWQVALRRQMDVKEQFAISVLGRKEYPGYYNVVNPISHNEYRVVYRGQDSSWNYCSCMDFKTKLYLHCAFLYLTREVWQVS